MKEIGSKKSAPRELKPGKKINRGKALKIEQDDKNMSLFDGIQNYLQNPQQKHKKGSKKLGELSSV